MLYTDGRYDGSGCDCTGGNKRLRFLILDGVILLFGPEKQEVEGFGDTGLKDQRCCTV